MIHGSILGCVGSTPVVALRRLFADFDGEILAKLEFFNPGGSVKDRPAVHILSEGLRTGVITPDSHVIESSSGNFGIALAMACRIHNLPLTIVVDPDVTQTNFTLLHCLGARVEMVTKLDANGCGYLEQRLRRVRSLVEQTPGGVWINQYANQLNWLAHECTAREIVEAVPGRIDYFVAAVSTAGTIHGVSRALRKVHPELRVVAVDAVGSVLFGGSPGRRLIPGIGASRVPELLHTNEIDEVIAVGDADAVRGCRTLLSTEAILAGGSSGSVVAALQRLIPRLPSGARVLTLFPDRGERYLDIVYGVPRRMSLGSLMSLGKRGSRHDITQPGPARPAASRSLARRRGKDLSHPLFRMRGERLPPLAGRTQRRRILSSAAARPGKAHSRAVIPDLR